MGILNKMMIYNGDFEKYMINKQLESIKKTTDTKVIFKKMMIYNGDFEISIKIIN